MRRLVSSVISFLWVLKLGSILSKALRKNIFENRYLKILSVILFFHSCKFKTNERTLTLFTYIIEYISLLEPTTVS